MGHSVGIALLNPLLEEEVVTDACLNVNFKARRVTSTDYFVRRRFVCPSVCM